MKLFQFSKSISTESVLHLFSVQRGLVEGKEGAKRGHRGGKDR